MRKTPSQMAQDDEDNEINLTPMLDVVFIMLIFFIVTASFIKEAGLDVNRPDVPETNIPEQNVSIVVNLTELNEIRIDGRIIDPRAVRANIERMHAEEPDAPVVIRPHVKSKNSLLITVMDAARQAGVYNISLTDPVT
ncbi:MAG: biopolymer transporter ExbD [Woeseiaceae bacterium]|nr:biopolymer transporter ExbD [Woeseiaceae bacterium]